MQVDIKVDPALKALGFNWFRLVESTSLSSHWFQISINLHPCVEARIAALEKLNAEQKASAERAIAMNQNEVRRRRLNTSG